MLADGKYLFPCKRMRNLIPCGIARSMYPPPKVHHHFVKDGNGGYANSPEWISHRNSHGFPDPAANSDQGEADDQPEHLATFKEFEGDVLGIEI